MCENKSSQRVKERIKQQEQNKNENMTQINNKKNRGKLSETRFVICK